MLRLARAHTYEGRTPFKAFVTVIYALARRGPTVKTRRGPRAVPAADARQPMGAPSALGGRSLSRTPSHLSLERI